MKLQDITVALLVSFSALSLANAATSQIQLFNPAIQVLDNAGNALLAGGAGDGDGDVMQLGYYTGIGSDTSTHDGTWTPIAGLGSANPEFELTIGDGGVGDGLYSISILFDNTTHSALPSSGTQLAIRFFDDQNLANATHYNTVTNENWVMGSFGNPTPAPVTYSAFDSPLVWEDGGNAFKTTLDVVPEPSSTALLGLGSLALILRRRR